MHGQTNSGAFGVFPAEPLAPILVKFTYSEKATNFCKISTLLLSVCNVDESKVEILQNFVAFSEYTNFKILNHCLNHGLFSLFKFFG